MRCLVAASRVTVLHTASKHSTHGWLPVPRPVLVPVWGVVGARTVEDAVGCRGAHRAVDAADLCPVYLGRRHTAVLSMVSGRRVLYYCNLTKITFDIHSANKALQGPKLPEGGRGHLCPHHMPAPSGEGRVLRALM